MYFLKQVDHMMTQWRLGNACYLLALCSSSLFLSSRERWRCAEEGATLRLNTWEAELLALELLEVEVGAYWTRPSRRLVIVASTLFVVTVAAT